MTTSELYICQNNWSLRVRKKWVEPLQCSWGAEGHLGHHQPFDGRRTSFSKSLIIDHGFSIRFVYQRSEGGSKASSGRDTFEMWFVWTNVVFSFHCRSKFATYCCSVKLTMQCINSFINSNFKISNISIVFKHGSLTFPKFICKVFILRFLSAQHHYLQKP